MPGTLLNAISQVSNLHFTDGNTEAGETNLPEGVQLVNAKAELQPRFSFFTGCCALLYLNGSNFFIAAGKITQQLFLRLLAYLQIDSTAGQWQW